MFRRKILAGLGALALLNACSDGNSSSSPELLIPFADNPDSRPDIVLVVADDMRWDLQSARGHEILNTKAMDALAAEGAMMENAFVPMALCSPSRGAILTGRDVHQSSAPRIAWRNNSFLDTQKTFAEYLQEAGYTTGYIGKWHLGDGSKPKRGFDHWESFDWLGDFFNPTIFVNGNETSHEGYVDDILAERAKNFMMDNRTSNKPVFLMVGLKAPHLQFEHPERYKETFEDIDIPRPETYDEDFAVSGKLQSIKDWLGMDNFHCGLNCFNNSWDKYIKFHYRAILGLDDSVGTIRSATEMRGKKKNTLFIYTSDNGYSLGDHGLTEKHFVYEEPIRVPLLVDFPGDEDKGKRFSELVSTLDIAPTILDYANSDIPEYMSGSSLRKLMTKSNEQEWRQDLFLLYEKAQAAVRTDDFKLIKSLNTENHYELYDLVNDPKETTNIYSDNQYETVRVDMRRRLKAITNKNDWTPRKSYPIETIYASSPVPNDFAEALGRSISSLSLAEFEDQIDNPALRWEIATRDATDPDSTFSLRSESSGEQGESVFVAVPLSRLSSWDPFVDFSAERTLSNNRTHTVTMYVSGKEVWSNREDLPLNAPNPPLADLNTLVILRFEDIGSLDFPLYIEAPEDTIYLPLEEKILGDSPNRFNKINSWHGNNNTVLSENAESLAVDSIDSEFVMSLTTDNVYVNEPSTLTVRYRASADSTMQVQWRSEYTGFSDENSITSALIANTQIQVMELLIDSASDIDSLRMEISEQAQGIHIEAITLTTLGGVILHNWDFNNSAQQSAF